MKNSVLIHMSLFIAMIFIVSPVFGDDPPAPEKNPQITVNYLEPLGNDAAPNAPCIVMFNTSGDYLDMIIAAKGLVPDKAYKITSSDCTLATGQADANGNLIIQVRLKDESILQTIASDVKRKFSLWQDNHRLAWSSDIYDFNYSANPTTLASK